MKKRLIILTGLVLALLLALSCVTAYADDLDEILVFSVTADVNEDATVNLVYHIEWKVLDSDSYGPLEWVKIGIPNSNYVDMKALSSTIDDISYMYEYGPYVRIDFDRAYYKDEVVSFDFLVVQDYLYEMNRLTDGETVYDFTPAWFDDIYIDDMIIKWNADKAISQNPSCQIQPDGYYTWEGYLDKGDMFTVTITYPNDAFMFDDSKHFGGYGGGYEESEPMTFGETVAAIFAGLIGLAVTFLPPVLIIRAIVRAVRSYSSSANFSSAEKKITRTKIVYYPNCPGCGAPRPDGANNCPYCGRSFIKSEEKIEEKDIPKDEPELRRKTTSGLYAYSHTPNTYIRINVAPAPVSRPSRPRSSGSSSIFSGGGSSHSSSSHHSSCAHSSCACACACACASSGRAGCSNKDFYNTDLKLRQLELREEK